MYTCICMLCAMNLLAQLVISRIMCACIEDEILQKGHSVVDDNAIYMHVIDPIGRIRWAHSTCPIRNT